MVSDLRSALGDTRSESKYVKTVHGFGYAFVGDVVWHKAVSSAAGAAAAEGRSGRIAVLLWGGQELLLNEGDNVIGRNASADLVIRSTGISRRHALVRLTDGVATIRDLDSKNGTFVRGAAAKGEETLEDGDAIRLGTILMTFRMFSDGDTTRTVV